jgi:hypothetical protein
VGLGTHLEASGIVAWFEALKPVFGRKPDFRQVEVWEVTPVGGDIGGLGNPFKGFGQRCVV